MRTGKQLATRLGPIALGWSLAAAILLGLSCAEKARPLKKGEGTRRMAARLDELIRNLNPINNQFLNAERAAFLRQAVQKAPIPEQRIMLTTNLADEMLKMGKPEEAIELILPFLERPAFAPGEGPSLNEVREFLTLGYLKLGEVENCIVRHSPVSCLLPIRGDGVHQAQRGSRSAIEPLLEILKDDPDNPGALWLLNIAHMTLGSYPDGVPEPYRIPPSMFESEAEASRFPNVAPRAGLAVRGQAGGGAMEDFDGDGFLDIMVSSMGFHDQLRLFRNNGDGTFSETTEAAGLTGEIGGLNFKHADYDNNGYADVLVLRGGWMHKGGLFPNSLLRNNGDGTFDDVTEEAGVLSFHPTQTAAWGDYDNDGWLDLFIGNETATDEPHPCELYHNNRDGTFTNKAFNFGDPSMGYVKGVAWGDFNNDGRLDLYVSVLGGDNRLYRNDGPRARKGPKGEDWRFTEVGREAGTIGPMNSFPVWFWDYDNDGWQDIMVAGYKTLAWDRPCRLMDCVGEAAALLLGLPNRMATPLLYHNEGDGTFTEVSTKMRLNRVPLAMGCNFGDIDNDGWLDAYYGTGESSLGTIIPNLLFRNDEGRSFQDVTTAVDVGHLQKGHGVAFGDIDNDGDQDLFIELGGFFEIDSAMSALFENPGTPHRWITLRLEGRRSNRSGVGARIRVRVRTPGGAREIHRTVGAGGSFGGNSLQQEIGLGNALAIEAIEIAWPATGEIQVFRDVT
ncbi:MAG: CRTAC1 family protein, partial [Acidobacteriota bacterium]